MKLLKIVSEAVDVVLMVVPDDYDEVEALEIACGAADMRGDVRIAVDLAIPDSFGEDIELRPFVG